ncbi:ArsR family transcriptional regulator [Paenibacillus sp. FSL R7-277]|uniref:ArsR family transcriptional regulator n=1 Tax=Paenibacillus sp. FSL R7-277 TaxID=1227352 RepID=UPI0003E2C1D4|nr:ArsR family transcriptional regulator [Paenibacillus sp. FSL R7-277]ETT57707.1 ArsR family transcriptional regulator [Paenibacillus sp. FSL R7-277]
MNHSLQETLQKNIRFAYNEAIEFMVSMGMLACEDQLAALAEDYKIEIDELLEAYFDEARKRLSPHYTRELMFFFGHNFFHLALDFPLYESICSYPEAQTVEEWLKRLENSPAEHIVSEMVYGVYNDNMEALLNGNEWELVKKDLKKLMELVADTKPQPEVAEAHAPLLECLAYPQETKLRYIQLLRQFHQDVFIHWKDRIHAISEQAALRYEAQFRSNPEAFIREVHKNEPALFDFPATFHVSFVSQVGNAFYNFHTEAGRVGWVIFGIHNERVYGPVADRQKTELFLKAFSDKRRLDLLLLLKQRPHYGKEIATALGITQAAVNYHSNFLFFLDLLDIERVDHRLYYVLRTETLRNLLALTAKVMLDEDQFMS